MSSLTKVTLFLHFEHSNPLKQPKIVQILDQIRAKKDYSKLEEYPAKPGSLWQYPLAYCVGIWQTFAPDIMKGTGFV